MAPSKVKSRFKNIGVASKKQKLVEGFKSIQAEKQEYFENMIKQEESKDPKPLVINKNRKIKINSWHHRKVEFNEKKVNLFIKHLKDIDVEDLNECNMEQVIDMLQKPKGKKDEVSESSKDFITPA